MAHKASAYTIVNAPKATTTFYIIGQSVFEHSTGSLFTCQSAEDAQNAKEILEELHCEAERIEREAEETLETEKQAAYEAGEESANEYARETLADEIQKRVSQMTRFVENSYRSADLLEDLGNLTEEYEALEAKVKTLKEEAEYAAAVLQVVKEGRQRVSGENQALRAENIGWLRQNEALRAENEALRAELAAGKPARRPRQKKSALSPNLLLAQWRYL